MSADNVATCHDARTLACVALSGVGAAKKPDVDEIMFEIEAVK